MECQIICISAFSLLEKNRPDTKSSVLTQQLPLAAKNEASGDVRKNSIVTTQREVKKTGTILFCTYHIIACYQSNGRLPRPVDFSTQCLQPHTPVRDEMKNGSKIGHVYGEPHSTTNGTNATALSEDIAV